MKKELALWQGVNKQPKYTDSVKHIRRKHELISPVKGTFIFLKKCLFVSQLKSSTTVVTLSLSDYRDDNLKTGRSQIHSSPPKDVDYPNVFLGRWSNDDDLALLFPSKGSYLPHRNKTKGVFVGCFANRRLPYLYT